MQTEIVSALSTACGLASDAVAKALTRPKELAHGDFAFPCFILAKDWKLAPPACATKLAAELKLPASVEKTQVVGPYLNFFLNKKNLAATTISTVLNQGEQIGKRSQRPETIVLEYSSPNIAKTLHIGHLRNTLIGLSLERIYKHLGYKVVTINHLGDWGTQFGFVWAGCELWGKPEEPSVESLVELYIRASALRKAQEENTVPAEDKDKPVVNEMAREYFKRLERGDADAVAFWQWCLDVSMDYFKNLYSRLGIHFDHYTGESFYRDKLGQVEEEVRKSGVLEESRGALGVDLGKKLGFVRVFTEDGRSLYITRDIATAMYREATFHPTKILYVIATQQEFYLKQLMAVLEKMKHPVASKMVHVAYGMVPGMSTREGGAISLKGFLEEAHNRARDVYRQEVATRPEGLDEEQLAEAVAIGATYFYFLSHSNLKDFHFNWTEALTFQGDSGPYLQYAVARINSIVAKARDNGIVVDGQFDSSSFDDAETHQLVSLLSRFDEILTKACADYEPFYVAQYLLDVARTFAKIYKELRVVGEAPELAKARLSLFVAVRTVLKTGLYLIGVPTVERM